MTWGSRRTRKIWAAETLEERRVLASTPIISEFLAVNTSNIQDSAGNYSDWIEIHNPTAQAVNLSGWHLTDDQGDPAQWTFPNVTLAANGYLVVFASGDDHAVAGQELHTNFRLDGGGEFLGLVNPAGDIVWSFAPEYPDQSDDVSFGFSRDESTVGYFVTPTPGAANTVDPVADPFRTVVINEIMYHPSSEADAEEYVELHNTGTSAINLDGWRISGGIDFDFSATTLSPGGYLVVSADPTAFAAKYGGGVTVVGPWTGRLSNQSDRITLRNAADQQVDRVTYFDEGEWSQRVRGPVLFGHRGWVWSDLHDGGGRSLELMNAAGANEFGQAWQASNVDQGTPGKVNSVANNNVAPLILDTLHSPAIPSSSDSIVVTSQFLDDHDSAVTGTLFWRLDGENAFRTVAMNDNGQLGDGAANDGIYSATIPAQADKTVVEFYVHASDAGGLNRTWPAPTDEGQVTNGLLQVLDDYQNLTWEAGDTPIYFEVMTGAERTEFTNINRSSDAQMHATFISFNSDGVKVRYNAGVRIRGSGSRNDTPPNNRINIPSDTTWEGVTALNLNTDTVQNQIAGSALMRLAGIPVAETKPITLVSNGQDLRSGVPYAHLEPLNRDFAANQFPLDPNGNLYKGRRPDESPPGGLGAGLVYQGTDPIPYGSYTKLTNESQADWSDVIHLTDVLNNTPDETYLEELAKVVDIDQWLRYFGFHALLSNTEGGLVNGDRLGDDYAMYSGVEDPRFKMVTHDMDTILSLGQVQRTIFAATNIPALRRMIYHPDLLPRYFEQMRDMIQNVLHSPRAEMALRESLRGVSSENDIQRMLQFLQARGDYVLSLIPNEVTVSPFLESGRDYWETDSASLAMVGTANFDAQSVTVNGRIATLSTDRSWQYGNYVTTIVSTSSTWRYLDDGSNQGTAWRELDFVPDNSWGEGQSQLGYGDNDERTVVGFGDDPNNKHVTTYFRQEFNISDASQYLTMDMGIIRDDGAAVYLNGQEIARLSLPDNADYQTLASDNLTGGSERSYTFIDLDPALLKDGKNVIAVEIHQAAVDSDDISMQLFVRGRYQPRNVTDLVPGVNRVTVRSMSGPDGTGEVLDETHLDVWYKGGTPTTVSGTLPSGQTNWTTANSPYLVTSDVVVPTDGTLVIQPGTSVFFAPDTELRVEGILEANGTADARIRFTAAPGQALVADEPGGRPGLPAAPPKWDGIHLADSRAANSIRYVDVEHAQDSEGSIGVINSNAVISNVTVTGTHLRMIYGSNASLILENSVFPDMFAENESPAALGLDNVSEHVKLIGRPPRDGGQLIIRNNAFGTNKGHNDVIDADSYQKGQGPLLQVIGNWFRGAGDELLDLGGDVYVADNFFQNVFKDDETSDRGYANAISTGDAGVDTIIVVARNVFYNVDHAINLKNSAATIFENNTVLTVHPDFSDRFNNPNVGSAINLYVDEPGARPGRGAYAAGNIFNDVPRVFGNADLPDETVSALRLVGNVMDTNVANSTVGSRPGTVLNLGSQNRIGDARVSGIAAGDRSLQAGSAAFNAYLSKDAGADVPPGAWITSSVQSPTSADTVLFTVGGPGIFAYQYRVNGGAWSDVRDIGSGFDGVNTVRTDTLTLSGLTNGNYVVEVQGQDFAGNWISEHLDSIEFTVQTNASRLLINEVLASNRNTFTVNGVRPDAIELYNAGGTTVNLKGLALSDDPDQPAKFVFADDQLLLPGQYYFIMADSSPNLGMPSTGFSLRREGEGVYLSQPTAVAGEWQTLDAVEFGPQIDDLSIGRTGIDRTWQLGSPSLGQANNQVVLGDPSQVRINEWLAEPTSGSDFVELLNMDSLPVDLGGFYITDEIGGAPEMSQFAPLTFLPANGFFAFDANNGDAADELRFALSLDQEFLQLRNTDGQVIDTVGYFPQQIGVSQGRFPDGADELQFFDLPSPGWANGAGFPGDFDHNGVVNVADIELLCAAVQGNGTDEFDLNADSQVNQLDVAYFLENIAHSTTGDANLDGVFNSSDLVAIFTAGEYEDGIAGNSTWSEGDWNCDGEFSTADLVAAFTSGGYVAAALPDLMDEPFPTGFAGVRSPNETNADSQLVAAAWRMHVDQLFAAEDDRPVRKASADFELSKPERAFFA